MNRHGSQGMFQIFPAHGFNNMVNAAIFSQRQYLLNPVAF